MSNGLLGMASDPDWTPTQGPGSSRKLSPPVVSIGRWLVLTINLLATVQVAWFYHTWVHSSLNSALYEAGLESTPYQTRVLMMEIMRWAHDSAILNAAALRLSSGRLGFWFEFGLTPEGLLLAPIDLVCVMIAGLVARALYNAASPTRSLSVFVYPFTLVLVLISYCIATTYHVRYPYDLPSLCLFSLGLYLIYFNSNLWLFIVVFVLATINRETSLMLLVFLALRANVKIDRPRSSQFFTVIALLAFWLGWHHWVGAHFAHNPSASRGRWRNNLYLLAVPLSWPQFFSVGAFTLPILLFYRTWIRDSLIRTWLWVVPAWLIFMIVFGVIIEVRIFGEISSYLACCGALVAETSILRRLADCQTNDEL